MYPLKILTNPVKYGYKECVICSGYGSSLSENRHIFCPSCNGAGIVKGKSKRDKRLKRHNKLPLIKSIFN
jgi:DNA-directed RNA polymerase subunit RPC12/RpoP